MKNGRMMVALFLVVAMVVSCAGAEGYRCDEIFSRFKVSTCWVRAGGSGGSGFFLEPDVVATNRHVIEHASTLMIETVDGKQHKVLEILSMSEQPDLALLRVDCVGTPVMRNSHPIREGMPVFTIGAPMGIYPCITEGRVMKAQHVDGGTRFILADLNTIGGNSGGAVFNEYGELVAVVVGGMSDGSGHIAMLITADQLDVMDRSMPVSAENLDDPVKYNQSDLQHARKGETLLFGVYEQDNDRANGVEPIEWIVLEEEDGVLTLMSRYCLDAMPFSSGPCTWETSEVRRFLNQDFYQSAFSEEEKGRILETMIVTEPNPVYGTDCGQPTLDKVSIMSIQEVTAFYGVDEIREGFYDGVYAIATPYTVAKNVWLEMAGSNRCWWWLRSMGSHQGLACEVGSMGYISYNGGSVTDPGGGSRGLRPVIRVRK